MKRLKQLLLIPVFICSCSDASPLPSDTNNRNNVTNNASNNGVNNTNNQTNATNNQTNQTNNYTVVPHSFQCEEITPTGMLEAGTYDITGLCIGFDPFEPFEMFCPGLTITELTSSNAYGTVWIDPPYYAILDGAQFDVTAVAREACKNRIGQGECAGIATAVEALVSGLTVSCVDIPNSGADDDPACDCDVVGSLGSRLAGRIEMSADGVATTTSYDANGNLVIDTIAFAIDQTGGVFAPQSNGDRVDVLVAPDATLCEAYCLAFLARCNDEVPIGYASEADCLEQCANFPVAGAPTMVGDSVECRLAHANLANDPTVITNQETYCPVAYATSVAPCNTN